MDPIKDALRAAARQFCICDGECYETRHGMMNGPCEQMTGQAAAAVAAFLPKAQDAYAAQYGAPSPQIAWLIAAVEKAARDAD